MGKLVTLVIDDQQVEAPEGMLVVDAARKAGIKRISKDALEELRDCIDELGVDIAEKAVKISRHAGRRTVKLKDVRFVTKT